MVVTSTIAVNFAWDKTLKCIAEHFWSGRSSVPEPACAFFTILQQAGPRLLGHIQSREHKTTPDKMASLFIGQKVASFIQVNMNSVEEWLQKLSCWSNPSKLHFSRLFKLWVGNGQNQSGAKSSERGEHIRTIFLPTLCKFPVKRHYYSNLGGFMLILGVFTQIVGARSPSDEPIIGVSSQRCYSIKKKETVAKGWTQEIRWGQREGWG